MYNTNPNCLDANCCEINVKKRLVQLWMWFAKATFVHSQCRWNSACSCTFSFICSFLITILIFQQSILACSEEMLGEGRNVMHSIAQIFDCLRKNNKYSAKKLDITQKNEMQLRSNDKNQTILPKMGIYSSLYGDHGYEIIQFGFKCSKNIIVGTKITVSQMQLYQCMN